MVELEQPCLDRGFHAVADVAELTYNVNEVTKFKENILFNLATFKFAL